MLIGLYYLGQNIFIVTNVTPYWWRGIAADLSILLLTLGLLKLLLLPLRSMNRLEWPFVVLGLICVGISGRALIAPQTLGLFVLTITLFGFGYRLFALSRLRF